MRLTASEIAAATGGTVHGPEVSVEGVTIDSRSGTSGRLFVPLRAERDGHAFIEAAVAGGATAFLTDGAGVAEVERLGATAIEVADTAAALSALGAAARRRLDAGVVGITGSVGKTTTKDQLAALAATALRTAASERSFNNELGVPLTILNAPDDTQALVLEMGARGVGHIGSLCEVGRPTVAVVTAVAAVHLEFFGSIDEVAVGKGELVEALPSNGTAVLNAADPRVAAMAARTDARVVFFGPGGEVSAESVVVDEELRPRFTLHLHGARVEVRLGVRGVHNVGNALAAAAAAVALGVPTDRIAEGLEATVPSPWRMELRRTPSGARVINDAYNAGPASMAAALDSLAAIEAARRIAVLGVMAELGPDEAAEHEAVAARAASLGIEVIAVGTHLYGTEPLPDAVAAAEALAGIDGDTAVLVKGSRVAGLEAVADALAPHVG